MTQLANPFGDTPVNPFGDEPSKEENPFGDKPVGNKEVLSLEGQVAQDRPTVVLPTWVNPDGSLDRVASNLAADIQPRIVSSKSLGLKTGKVPPISPPGARGPEGSLNQQEADSISEKSRLTPSQVPGYYYLEPSKADGIVKNVVQGYFEGTARLDPETIVGRLIGSPEAIKFHKDKWYGVAGEKSVGKPGELWYEKWANGFGQSLPSLLVGGGIVGGMAGSGALATGAIASAPSAVESALTTIPEALAESGNRGKAVLEGATNAAVTFAAFTFLGPLGKLFSKPVAEQLLGQSIVRSVVKGGLNMGAASLTDQVGRELSKELIRSEEGLTNEKLVDIFTNPDKWKDRAEAALPMVLIGMGTHAMVTTLGKMKPNDYTPQLIKEGLVTPAEVKILNGDRAKVFELAKARFDGKLGEIVEVKDAAGGSVTSISSKPDVLSYEHKKALGFSEPAITLVRDNILKGKNTIEDVFPAEGTAKIKLALDTTNLKRPEVMTDDLQLRRRVAVAQGKYREEVLNLASDQNNLPINQRIMLKEAVTAEFNARMERWLKKDDNSPVGAKEQIVKRIRAKVAIAEAPGLNERISNALKDVTSATANMTQRETVARLMEHFADQGKAGEVPFVFLDDLYTKMISDPAYQPYSERIKTNLDTVNKFVDDNLISALEFNDAKRAEFTGLVKTLPDNLARPLLEKVSVAKEKADFQAIAKKLVESQETLLRDIQTTKIERAVVRLKTSPRRAEALALLGKDLTTTNQNSGELVVDVKALQKKLKKSPVDQLQNIANDLSKIVRQGQIEKGLYNKWLKFSTTQDKVGLLESLKDNKSRSELRQGLDKPLNLAGYAFDPVMTDVWLQQVTRGDTNHPMWKIFHQELVPKFSQHFVNMKSARLFVRDIAKDIYKINLNGVLGQYSLAKYMKQKLPSGITRGEAMYAYALDTDLGRSKAVREYGIESRGKVFDIDKGVGELSAKDIQFTQRLKVYFDNNPTVKRAFQVFGLLNGYEPPKRGGYIPSRRKVENTQLDETFNDWQTTLTKEIDPLKAVDPTSKARFDLEGGLLDVFYRVADKMSLYAELGTGLYRAEKLLLSNDVNLALKEKFGEGNVNRLKRYINNMYGRLGGNKSNMDHASEFLTTSWTLSRVAWNFASAAKQYLSFGTLFADGTIDRPALTRAIAEGATFNPAVKKRMITQSGVAFQRYTGGRFLQTQLVTGDGAGSPSKLSLAQHYGMVLQRNIDKQVMAVAWRAAEIGAKSRGMTGVEFHDYVRDTFELSLGRTQGADHPLYSSDIELEAKGRPMVRGMISFMREPNRVYNVVRRKVVQAAQAPTEKNIKDAGYALVFAVGATSLGSAAINGLRKTAFGQVEDSQDFALDTLKAMSGLWYAGSAATSIVESIFDPQSQSKDKGIGPIPALFKDFTDMLAHASSAADKGEDEAYTSGVKRGYNKQDDELIKTLDSAFSLTSGLLGLPFWALWYQGKGLYNWEKQDYILMTELEQERIKLNKQPDRNATRLFEINATMKEVNKLHSQREKGLLSKDRARAMIVRELERNMK